MWAVLAAPFLLSTDLRTVKPEIKELLLNRDIIAVDQDDLGIQGRMINKGNGIEVWAKKVLPKIGDNYSYAVAFVSRRTDGHPHAFDVTLKDLTLENKFGYQVKVRKRIIAWIHFCKSSRFQDLFNLKRNVYHFTHNDTFEERVNPTGANFYKFIPLE